MMEELKKALTVIKLECSKHQCCHTCPMYVEDDVFGRPYCSITRDGDLPAEWNVEDMVI
jgi:hypothetical protein